MTEAILAMQRLIEWIDAHAVENPGLAEMSKQIGYSPYYCSEQFHRLAGITIKEYMARRRLSLAALAIRDTDRSLIDIALDYGFSSQSALTRAFVNAFGCTPAAYRRNPAPIPMQIRKCIVSPSETILKGDIDMSYLVLPSYRMEYIPAHKYLGVYKPSETANGPIWAGHDCDLLCGIISSMTNTHPIVTGMTAAGNGMARKNPTSSVQAWSAIMWAKSPRALSCTRFLKATTSYSLTLRLNTPPTTAR